jgi:hypothetical protein
MSQNKTLSRALAFILFVTTLLVGSISSADSSHIKYYGYYGSAFEGVGMGDYTASISDHSNLTWIVNGNIVKKLSEAKARNMKAVLDVQWYFMDANYHLRPDVIASWKKLAAAIAPYRDTIAAFYPMDEPYMNGKKKGLSEAQVKANIETVASITKSTFPEIPVAVIFSSGEVKDGRPIPVGFDWIGFDCYGKFNDCNGHSIGYYVSKIKGRIKAPQRIMLVPWAYKEGTASAGDISARVNASNQYWSMAVNESVVIAVVPFLYQTFTGSDGKLMTGAHEMPALLQNLKPMGLTVKKAQAAGPKREAVTSPAHNIAGNIDGVVATSSSSWSIRGWACAQGINKSINVHLYVGGPAGGGGKYISQTLASKTSEDAVAAACRATGTAYRFDIPVSATVAANYGDKAIYVHGISPVGGPNLTIGASGKFMVPGIGPAGHDVIGNVDGVVAKSSSSWVIRGWACAQAINSPINVHLYVGGPAGGGGTYISQTLANKASEAAVASACKATGSTFRFEIPISSTVAAAQKGKKIYVHGISPVHGTNNVITGSGVFLMP